MRLALTYDIAGETRNVAVTVPHWIVPTIEDGTAALSNLLYGEYLTFDQQGLTHASVDGYPRWLRYDYSEGTSRVFEPMSVGTVKAALVAKDARYDQFDSLSLAKNLIYELESHKRGRDAAIFIGYFVQRSFNQRQLAEVNLLLGSIALERVTRWSMVALLRSTFSARSILPSWRSLLNDVESKVSDDADVERLLAGLRDCL